MKYIAIFQNHVTSDDDIYDFIEAENEEEADDKAYALSRDKTGAEEGNYNLYKVTDATKNIRRLGYYYILKSGNVYFVYKHIEDIFIDAAEVEKNIDRINKGEQVYNLMYVGRWSTNSRSFAAIKEFVNGRNVWFDILSKVDTAPYKIEYIR